MSQARWIPWAAGLGAAAIWGGMYVVSKVVLEVIPPFALLSLRLLLGAASLWLVLAWQRSPLWTEAGQLWRALAVGFVGYGVSLGFQFVGTKLSTAANGALVTSATPALVLPFAALLLGEKITGRRWAAIALASLGVLAVIDPRGADFSSNLFWGNLSLLGAALTWALYSTLVRKFASQSNLLLVTGLFLLGGLPLTLPMSAWEISHQGLGTISAEIVAGVLFLGIVCTALAMFLWNFAFARLPASSAALTFFAQPLVGSLLGWAFLGEEITPLFVLGGVLIAGAIALAGVE